MDDPSGGLRRSPVSSAKSRWERKLQAFLDASVPHIAARWAFFAFVIVLYTVRVLVLQGFYIVTYGIGIFNLNLIIGFLTPAYDPDQDADGPALPTTETEFKPFVRRVPEFKFWLNSLKSFLIGFGMTFFSVFDIPVFWPILLVYWIMLFVLTMKRQIKHMIKHRYLPFTRGKPKPGAGGGEGAQQGLKGGGLRGQRGRGRRRVSY